MNPQDPEVSSAAPYYNSNKPVVQENKRKGDENDSPAQGRSKRNRYISIACNECKRRKIKCNGESPCQRCGNLSLECIYAPNCCSSGFKDSEEFRSMSAHLQSLQQQINELWATVNALRNGQSPFSMHPPMAQADSPSTYRGNLSDSHRRTPSHPPFHGPSSSTFNFDLANSTIRTMGIAEPEASEEVGAPDIDPALGVPTQHQAPVAAMMAQSHKDPIWQISKDEALRLCKVYEEEMGIMYPMLDMEKIMSQADIVFTLTESASRTGLMNRDLPGSDAFESNDINILKMVLAGALTIEGCGQSDLGRALYDSCREAFEGRLSRPVEIKGLILLVIVAEYHFQMDEEAHAYRITGLAARQCLELGLHRRESLMKLFPIDEERSWVTKLFWSIYVLDRRWSMGTGMPFALQDADIDPSLPEPDTSTPYLTAMVSYSRICSKVWRSTNTPDDLSSDVQNNIALLDYSIIQWHESIPNFLKFNPTDIYDDSKVKSRGQRRLQVILYLRTNQLRTQLYRPVLHSATSIMEHRENAQIVVDIAKDTIGVLTRLNEATDIYRTQQVCFNYFLVNALAVLFLAVSHAPLEFSRHVRDEFYQGLEIVKGFSNKSYTSQRLWSTLKSLKKIGPKLGLVNRQTQLTNADDPHSSAAVAMAGLAGHAIDEMVAYTSAQNGSSSDSSPLNGQQISSELTNLFEAADDYGNNSVAGNLQGVPAVNGYVASQGQNATAVEGFSGMYGSEGEFSKIVGNLF